MPVRLDVPDLETQALTGVQAHFSDPPRRYSAPFDEAAVFLKAIQAGLYQRLLREADCGYQLSTGGEAVTLF